MAAHKPAGKWYNMYSNMSGEMYMLRRSHAVKLRYSPAYPTDASALQVPGCLSEANPKGRKGSRENVDF